MIGIIDYNAGNITSVERALKSLGIDFLLSKKPSDLKACEKLIFPGVGDAAYAMTQLKESGFHLLMENFCGSTTDSGENLGFSFHEPGEEMRLTTYLAAV